MLTERVKIDDACSVDERTGSGIDEGDTLLIDAIQADINGKPP